MNSCHSKEPAPHTIELDGLLEISALATLTKGLPQLQDRSERLARILGAAVQHLDCFALDDFGTGANSLKNLTNLPVDRVKIDGRFVPDILTNPQSAAIVRAIVTLARDLGINTVAEYAESEQIIQRLRELGVEYAQGYAIEKPRARAQVLAEFRSRQGKRPPEVSASRVWG
jgi:EAL domain-containing protein (putative c-di-GMP-specific phosphodiesterase class I)